MVGGDGARTALGVLGPHTGSNPVLRLQSYTFPGKDHRTLGHAPQSERHLCFEWSAQIMHAPIISRSKITMCLRSSRAMPGVNRDPAAAQERGRVRRASSRAPSVLPSSPACSGLRRCAALGIDALPMGTLRLDPIPARPARVTRRQALGHDTLKSKLVAVVEQQGAIWKSLHLFQERHLRLAAKPGEIALALGQGKARKSMPSWCSRSKP